MKQIRTIEDFDALQREPFEPRQIAFIKERFSGLERAFREDGVPWDPEVYGYFCLLEPEDDVRDLREVGLNPEGRGLIGVIKEVVVWHQSLRLWDVLVLFNNDFGINFYIPETEWLDAELRSVLEMEAEEEMHPSHDHHPPFDAHLRHPAGQ